MVHRRTLAATGTATGTARYAAPRAGRLPHRGRPRRIDSHTKPGTPCRRPSSRFEGVRSVPAISARRESRACHPPLAARRLAVTGPAALVLALALVLSGCATHPPATSLPRPVTHALPQDTPTPLRDALAAAERAHPGESGFRVLPPASE